MYPAGFSKVLHTQRQQALLPRKQSTTTVNENREAAEVDLAAWRSH